MAGHPVLDCVDCEFGREDGLQICECAGRDFLGNDVINLEFAVTNRDSAVKTLLAISSPNRNFFCLLKL
jgi:hypothetical protein